MSTAGYVQDILAAELSDVSGKTKILVAGDSWANVVGSFGSLPSFLERKLTEHGCNATTTCIAIPGTETGDWASGVRTKLDKLCGRQHIYIYIYTYIYIYIYNV